MLTTLELRWFSQSTVPTAVEQWFNSACPGEPLGAPEARTDRYLYTPDCDYLNLKLRKESLEVKWRRAELGLLRLDRWEGNVEKWLKWACEDSTQQSLLPADVVEKPWVEVKKVRAQRLYQDIACELTQLQLRNDDWWSVAFEVPAETVQGLERFEEIIRAVSQTYQGPTLTAAQSYGYPRWLSLIQQKN